MTRRLQGQVIAITGASSGIGEALAAACGREGMRVGIFARRHGRLEDVAHRVSDGGAEVEIVEGDVRDREALSELVTRMTRRWNRLDVMVANAGFGISARVADTDPDEAREIFDVNVLGSVWAIQAAWPIFEMQKSGHVILVSSILAKHASPAAALYSATKAAQMSLGEGLRVEGESLGIDVSVVYPIGTDTEFVDSLRDHIGWRDRRPAPDFKQPRLRRPRQSAEQVADAIVRCLKEPQFEVYPYRRGRLLPFLEALSPQLTARLLGFPETYRLQMQAGETSAAESTTAE